MRFRRLAALGSNLPMHITDADIGRGVKAAEETNADLVVIASQDRRPLVARGLVDSTSCWVDQ